MDFLRYRVKVMEAFKDGNVLGGRFLKPNEILIVSEADYLKITNSGGTLEILDSLIPNPKVESAEMVEAKITQAAEKEQADKDKEAEVAQAEAKILRAEAEVKPEPKRRGRPRKVQ